MKKKTTKRKSAKKKIGTIKVTFNGPLKDGSHRFNAVKVTPFNKKEFLKKALPVVGIDSKKTIEAYCTLVENDSSFFTDLVPALAKYVCNATRNSADIAQLRTKIHLAIRELQAVMELTIQK